MAAEAAGKEGEGETQATGRIAVCGLSADGVVPGEATPGKDALLFTVLGGANANVTCLALGTAFGVAGVASAGETPSCIVSWGCGRKGRLGQGSQNDCFFKPAPAKTPASLGRVTSVACGQWHALAVDDQGLVLHTGYAKSAPADSGPPGDRLSFTAVPGLDTLLPGAVATQVAAGDHACAVLLTHPQSGGQVATWGHSSAGLLGTWPTRHQPDITRATPALVDAVPSGVTQVSLGQLNGAAVLEGGQLWVWGDKSCACIPGVKPSKAQAAAVTAPAPHPPTQAALPEGVQVTRASCAPSTHHGHILATDTLGRLWGWGSTYKGQLGCGEWDHATQDACVEPVVIPPFTGPAGGVHPAPYQTAHAPDAAEEAAAPFAVVPASGGIHSAVLDAKGSVWTWGCGSDGRLGHSQQLGHRYLYREGQPRAVTQACSGKGKPLVFRASALAAGYKQTALVGTFTPAT